MPNPFYQIYEGAALLAGAEPYFLNTTAAHRLSCPIWTRCRLRSGSAAGCCILCSPGNPTGAMMSLAYLRQALELAERYDFIIAADECYCGSVSG